MNRAGFSLVLVIGVLSAMNARADLIVEDQSDAGLEPRPSSVIVPYAFSIDGLDTGVGAVYLRKDVFQPQDGMFLAAYATSNSSYGLFAGMFNVQLAERLFFNPMIGVMLNDQQRFYGELGDPNKIPSGSNESDENDFIFGSGLDSYLHLTFQYVLPTGAGRETPPHHYITRDGLLVDGSTRLGGWSPRTSGRTFLFFRPFYQRRTMEIDAQNVALLPPELGLQEGDEPDFSTNGIMLGIEYDNRDFTPNPTRGSLTELRVTRDFGWLDSFNSWTSIEFGFSKYWALGHSKRFSHRVFAMNAWTAYVPTWETELITLDFGHTRNRPPSNRGASLGGVKRLRGYPGGRFNDKAAIYYGAELRLIPRWDPFRTWPVIRHWSWRWWQIVGFAEVGRVAPAWRIDDLHEDLKWSTGFGFRIMLGSSVARIDFATSEEGFEWWVMVQQAF